MQNQSPYFAKSIISQLYFNKIYSAIFLNLVSLMMRVKQNYYNLLFFYHILQQFF